MTNSDDSKLLINEVDVVPEPPLEFRYKQTVVDPHDGLSIFGPYDADMASHPKNISYGLVCTSPGLGTFNKWSQRVNAPFYPDLGMNQRLWPAFPGFEAAFASTWPEQCSRLVTIDEQSLIKSSLDQNPFQRVYNVVNHYLEGIKKMEKRDEPIDVIVCVVPDVIYTNCRIMSRVSSDVGYRLTHEVRRQREQGQLYFLDDYGPEVYQYALDFRRQIKARAMEYNIPIQIVRESTLRLTPSSFGERGLSPLSDRAWNLSVALYYKAGGKPWRLSSAREGVCYVGLVYRKKDRSAQSKSACCAAQMFLDSGDGIVFIGDDGPWYSPMDKIFHLDRTVAKNLLQGILETYSIFEGKPIKEIFIHCRSSIGNEEFDGFKDACPENVKLIGIRVNQDWTGVRLFREGSHPVLRGTFWQVNDHGGYLWGTGYKPRIDTYDGWEVPVPLRIDIQHGEAGFKQVATDILGLTKLNYNACRLGEAQPVTIKFSNAIGEILVSNPTVKKYSHKFKFYI